MPVSENKSPMSNLSIMANSFVPSHGCSSEEFNVSLCLFKYNDFKYYSIGLIKNGLIVFSNELLLDLSLNLKII